jgi:hypothetical protein
MKCSASVLLSLSLCAASGAASIHRLNFNLHAQVALVDLKPVKALREAKAGNSELSSIVLHIRGGMPSKRIK